MRAAMKSRISSKVACFGVKPSSYRSRFDARTKSSLNGSKNKRPRRLREEENIDGVILGGTELTLLLSDVTVEGIPALDTTELHVGAIVERLRR